MNPWDLDPDIWNIDSSGIDIAKVHHDLSCVVHNTCLVGVCPDPCPSDRWCTEQLLPFEVLSKSIDPQDLVQFVDAGPMWIQNKRVRFNDQPDIIIIDEGASDDDFIQADAVNVATESVVSNHSWEAYELPDGSPDHGTQEFSNFDFFSY